VISWEENLPQDEQPPRLIWWSDELLEEWFEEVKAARGTTRARRRKSSYDEADDVPMVGNELAGQYREAMLSGE
jgi:hypothetical protein